MREKKRKSAVQTPDLATVASMRICLAMLRVLRNVRLEIPEHQYDVVIAPFWSLIREMSVDISAAFKRRFTAKTARGLNDKYAPYEDLLVSKAYPIEVTLDIQTPVGDALVNRWPEFAGVFEQMESRLIERLAQEHVPTDYNVDLLADALDFTAPERAFLRLACALEHSGIDWDFNGNAKSAESRFRSVQHALNLKSVRDARDLMLVAGNLVRSGLLENDLKVSSDLEEGLRLSNKGVALLNQPAQTLEDLAAVVLKPLAPAKTNMPLDLEHLGEQRALIEKLLSNAVSQGACGVNILLYGAPGTGKTDFAAELVEKLGMVGYSVDDEDENGQSACRSERLTSLKLSQVFAPGGKSILVLDEAEDIFRESYFPGEISRRRTDDGKSWMNTLLESNRVPVIWISNRVAHMDPAYLRRYSYCLEFPTTPRRVRQNIAMSYLEPIGCSAELINAMAESEHISPALYATASRVVSMIGAQDGAVDAITRHVLTDHVKAVGREMPAHVPSRSTRFDMGYLHVKGHVTPGAVVQALSRSGKGSLLLSGLPGTGKTQLAAEIASRLGRQLVYKTAADINSMWYGQSERNVASMFSDCDPKTEVLFLDEADTLLGAREAAHQRADRAVTAEFLRRVEAFEGVFVCATNHSMEFDSAMMRRFVFRLTLLPLTQEQRVRLFCECALGWAPDSGAALPELDRSTIAQLAKLDQLTPGDYANVVKRVRSLDLELNPNEWVDELQAESDVKPVPRCDGMGFL